MSVSMGSVWGVQAEEVPAETTVEQAEEVAAKDETEEPAEATFVTSFRATDHQISKEVEDKEEAAGTDIPDEEVAKAEEAVEPDQVAKPEKAVEAAEGVAKKATEADEEVAKVEQAIEEEERVSGFAANPYGKIISRYATQYGLPEALAHAVVQVESNFRPDVTGAAGEIGLMQLKLSTARMMGYEGSAKDLYDPETNIKYGMKYLAKAHELGGGTTCGTILKYNAGHAAKRMNPISANYCEKVVAML
jgi:soluble lytic murein transglycosylase-like protein